MPNYQEMMNSGMGSGGGEGSGFRFAKKSSLNKGDKIQKYVLKM